MHDDITAEALAVVQGDVSAFEKFSSGADRAGTGYGGDADAQPHLDSLAVNQQRLTGDGLVHLVGDGHGIGHGRLAAEHEEFVAAEAAQHVGATGALSQQARDLAQHVVAGLVPVLFIDCLEVVEIDEDDAADVVLTHRALDLVLHEFFEVALVVEAGEGGR